METLFKYKMAAVEILILPLDQPSMYVAIPLFSLLTHRGIIPRRKHYSQSKIRKGCREQLVKAKLRKEGLQLCIHITRIRKRRTKIALCLLVWAVLMLGI
ncbi:hypothetical protein GUJ93_ZPchr0010g10356 [Zizania palustris]|uniref:Uncharacterized protein n=1 Tax=Zizania palustris TaxID=103762 RepID=A0A8J5W7C0_ZIZPA|nr:hypothetical protein GUJ93_ZPchr0010g10356 [Zizania palustris]